MYEMSSIYDDVINNNMIACSCEAKEEEAAATRV